MHKESERIGKKGEKVISPTRTLEVSYNLHKHEVNMVGKRVLGLIAIENALHPVLNSIGASLPATYQNPVFDEALQRNVDSKKTNKTRLLLPHNKINGNISLSGTDTADGLDNIGDLFSQMMNGAVDVEKNPWIFFIQGNYEIAPMITFLLKAGVPKEHAIMFVSNPLVREYAKQQRIIKGAYAKMTGIIDENFPETMSKYQAAVNALETVGIKKAGSLVSAKGYYKAAVDATSKSGILNDALEFDIKMMSKLVKNPNAPELQNHAVAMFLHFLELEKSTRGYTSLKFMSNPDTKTSKTLQEIIRRNLSIEDAKSMSTIEEGTVEKMMDSILGSFYDNKLIGDLIVPLFPLRNNDTVTDYIVKTIQLKQNIITRTFGRGHDGTRRFITEFKNAIPNYIYQNYMSNFIDENGNITSMPDNFKEFPVKEKAGVKNGAQIINGTLYIDKTRLSNEYSKKLYLRDNIDAASYTKQGLRGFGNVEKLFPNESTYFKYVFERELQRNLYSMKSLETNKDYLKINSVIKDPAQSYEAYINQRALINAFNRETIMTLDGQSYTDMVLNMVEEFSELKNKYPILTQFTIPKVKTGERVLSLNDTKSLKDAQLAEIYFQNLEDLGNEDIKKVIDPEDNKRISKLFALLPQMMMYQHGIGYSKYGFTRALPYKGFIGVMQTASEIFINKQLKEDTLAVIFDKLVEPGNKVFKNLLVTPKQYLAPEPSVVKEEDEFMSEEEAAAMLEKMGIKPIGEESTQPSTSVKVISNSKVDYTRNLVENNPRTLYIFTDNTDRDSGSGLISKDSWYSKKYGEGKHYPTMTTALIRGLDNARPISTQRWYNKTNKGVTGRWNDSDINEFKTVISDEINEIKKAWASGNYDNIIIPSKDGFFDGAISKITKERTPALYNYLQESWNNFEQSLTSTQPFTSVKEGVSELFDSNPELADQVYEALEFQNKQELENLKKEFSSFSNIRDKFKGDLKNVKNLVSSFTQMSADANFYKPFATDISEQRKKEIISGNATSYIFEDNFDDYRKTIKKSLDDELKSEADRFNYWFERGDTYYYFDTENKKYYSVTSSMKNEDGIEITKKEYYDALDDYKDALEKKNLQDQEDVKENVLRQPFLEGRTVRLFDNHFVIVTKHVIKEKGDLFINEIEFMYYDEFNYDRLKELEKQKITPLQKQQAQQKFQEYVDATGKQDIEGFKKFVTQPSTDNLNAPDGLPGIPRTSTDCQ
jgi:hypothetical protein